MDGLVDILITIGIFVIFFASSSRKLKKIQQQQQRRQQQQKRQYRQPAPQPVAPTSYEEIPKNQPYFTYETFEPEIKDEVRKEETSSGESVENNVQNTDNEMEKTPQISLEMEDIYRGVIYSEILKRPYN